MTPGEIVRLRLTNQHITAAKFTSVKEVVSSMGALQAQDYTMVKWAVGVRLSGLTEAMVEEAINHGDIVRTHLMRPTWHLVSADDVRWMLKLTAPHIKKALTSRHKFLDITDKTLKKSNDLIIQSLKGNHHLTRDELVTAFKNAGMSTTDNRPAHLLLSAELDGILCSGVTRGKLPTYALLSERVPANQAYSREEALVKLAHKYFSSHGPATLHDFVWWSGLPVADARKALEMIKADLHAETVDSETYWLTADNRRMISNQPVVHLLPAYDEFIISYKDRTASLAEENIRQAVSSNGIFYPVIIVNGKVTGLWKRRLKNGRVMLETNFFNHPDKKMTLQVREAATRYGRFLGKEVEVS